MGSHQEYTESLPLIQAIEDKYKKLVVQQLLKSYYYYRLRASANVMKVYDVKQVPMYLAPPQLGKWIGKGDPLPDGGTTSAVQGFWTNRYLVVPSGYDLLEMWQKEHDPSQIFDMADLRAAEVAWAMRRTLASAAWNGTGGKMPDGITTIIEAAAPGSQVAVVGGVNKATKPWFRNQYVQLTSNFGYVAPGTTLPAGILAILSLIDQCTVGTLVPSDLITTRAVFNMVKRAMLEMSTAYHLINERDTAKFGFQNFMIDGSYIAWDPYCPADKMYAMHITDQFDANRTGDPRDKTRLDGDLEDIGKSSVYDLSGSWAIIKHPNIDNRRVAARSPYRYLQSTEWIVDSFNNGVWRLSDQGVLGDNGSNKLSTWS